MALNAISFLVYCRELASGTVSLTGDRTQGDDSKHDSHYKRVSSFFLSLFVGVVLIFLSRVAIVSQKKSQSWFLNLNHILAVV